MFALCLGANLIHVNALIHAVDVSDNMAGTFP